jgi:hypothetical protein
MYVHKLDGVVDTAFFEKMSTRWRDEQSRSLREIERHQQADRSCMDEGVQLLELARNAQSLFEQQEPHEKRRLLHFVLSNCTWEDGEVVATFRQPFDLLAETAEKAFAASRSTQAEPSPMISLPGAPIKRRGKWGRSSDRTVPLLARRERQPESPHDHRVVAELVIQPDPDDVIGHSLVGRKRTKTGRSRCCESISHASQVNVEVFELGRPIWCEHGLHPSANSPAALGCAEACRRGELSPRAVAVRPKFDSMRDQAPPPVANHR